MASRRRQQTKRLRWQGMDPVVHNGLVAHIKRNRMLTVQRALLWGGLLASMRVFSATADQVARQFAEHAAKIVEAHRYKS